MPDRSASSRPDPRSGPRPGAPDDAADRRAIPPVICYPVDALPRPDLTAYRAVRDGWTQTGRIVVPPREAACFTVPAGHFFRICSVDGPQVGDLNLFHAGNLEERFYSGKTRALNGSHVGEGDQLFSCFPWLRPMATVTADTLGWYGIDEHGGAVHDVIGTRCDPYTHVLLSGGQPYHHCCHSNLSRAMGRWLERAPKDVEHHVHDVLNVFMCTGFTRGTGEYFMKASPVRPGDFLEFFAEIDLLGCLSACPGGDCSTLHSSDAAACFPLVVETYAPERPPAGWRPPAPNGYDRSHGCAPP